MVSHPYEIANEFWDFPVWSRPCCTFQTVKKNVENNGDFLNYFRWAKKKSAQTCNYFLGSPWYYLINLRRIFFMIWQKIEVIASSLPILPTCQLLDIFDLVKRFCTPRNHQFSCAPSTVKKGYSHKISICSRVWRGENEDVWTLGLIHALCPIPLDG